MIRKKEPHHLTLNVCASDIECVCISVRAEEEAAGRAKAEKEKRDLQNLLQETQDDLESERESRQHAERQKKQHSDVSYILHFCVHLHVYILHVPYVLLHHIHVHEVNSFNAF